MTNIRTFMVASAVLGLVACASPASTETTTTDSVHRSEAGGEVRRSSTETHEVMNDGVETTDRTETTETTPPDTE